MSAKAVVFLGLLDLTALCDVLNQRQVRCEANVDLDILNNPRVDVQMLPTKVFVEIYCGSNNVTWIKHFLSVQKSLRICPKFSLWKRRIRSKLKRIVYLRRKSRSTRSGNRSSTKRRLRALAEIPDYNDYSDDELEFLDDDGEANDVRDDDEDFLPVGRGRGKLPLIRKRFLPKGKRTFFKGIDLHLVIFLSRKYLYLNHLYELTSTKTFWMIC